VRTDTVLDIDRVGVPRDQGGRDGASEPATSDQTDANTTDDPDLNITA